MQNSAFVGSPESFQKVLSANAKLKTRLRVLTLQEMPGKYVKRKSLKTGKQHVGEFCGENL